MSRCIAVALLFAVAADVAGQPEMPPLPFPVIEQVKDGAFHGWKVTSGFVDRGPDGIILGGKEDATKLELSEALGENWKLQLEYKFQQRGAAPTLNVDSPRPFPWTMPGSGDRWVQVTLNCQSRGGWSRSFWINHSFQSDGSSGSGGLSGGPGQVKGLTINVPPGCTMVIRRIALQTSPPMVKEASGLYIGISVLGGCFVAVMLLGWLANRRRPRPVASASPAGERAGL